MLVTDSVYGRRACSASVLPSAMGIATTFFSPTITAAKLKEQFRPETKAVFLESPGSITFEVQDVPATRGRRAREGHRRHPRQHLGDAAPFRCDRPRRRSVGAVGDEIYRRPCRCAAGLGDRQRRLGGPPGAGAWRSRAVCVRRRRVPDAARAPHAGRAPEAPPGERDRARDLAQDPSGSGARALPAAPRGFRSRAVEARFHRRVRPLQHRAPRRERRGGRRHAERA